MYDVAEYGDTLKSWVVPTYMLCAYNHDNRIKYINILKLYLALINQTAGHIFLRTAGPNIFYSQI